MRTRQHRWHSPLAKCFHPAVPRLDSCSGQPSPTRPPQHRLRWMTRRALKKKTDASGATALLG
eukprot:4817744-Lingulodinium_polyedra.AAC.1